MPTERVRLPGAFSRRALLTSSVIAALTLAFAYATYLSYGAGVDISSAFAYQSAVVAAQRDSELLDVEQFDRRTPPEQLRPLVKLLDSDLVRIDSIAQTADERAPRIHFPASREEYDRLTDRLRALEALGRERFEATSRRNTHTRDLSNALFVLVSLLFAVFVGRLRERIEEGRSLVERLQRAFISKRRTVRNLDVGSVLLSATRGSNVGGDVYDVFTFDDRFAMFFVGDVSGKGIEAAVDTALIKYSMRTLFASERDPGTMLERFSNVYARSAENPETFVVMFLGVIDLLEGTLHYASAGHEPAWAIFGAEISRLPPTGPILGIELGARYLTRTIQLHAGDALVITTDGLTESRDPRGRLLGADAVTEWLASLRGNAQGMADGIVRLLRRRSRSIDDDLAVLVVSYAPISSALARSERERAKLRA